MEQGNEVSIHSESKGIVAHVFLLYVGTVSLATGTGLSSPLQLLSDT